jgi:hypothetical protein
MKKLLTIMLLIPIVFLGQTIPQGDVLHTKHVVTGCDGGTTIKAVYNTVSKGAAKFYYTVANVNDPNTFIAYNSAPTTVDTFNVKNLCIGTYIATITFDYIAAMQDTAVVVFAIGGPGIIYSGITNYQDSLNIDTLTTQVFSCLKSTSNDTLKIISTTYNTNKDTVNVTWKNSAGNVTVSYPYTKVGVYRLVATLLCNAKSLSTDTVGNSANQLIGYVYLNGGATIVDTSTTPTSINTISETSINIYPNPVDNQLTIKYNGIGNVWVYDNTGKLIFVNKFVNNINIDMSGLTNGIYYVKLFDEALKVFTTEKIIKIN